MGSTEKSFKPNKVTLLTILLSSMVIIMGAAAVAPALKPISEAFPDQSAYMISLVITLPALSVAITGFGVGYLADRFGKAKVFIISLAIFTLAGVSGFFLNDFTLILAGRFILGIGITGISLTTTALIAEYWTGMDRAKVIGYQAAAMGVGTLFLETLGGSLAEIGWAEPFLIYLIGVPIIIFGLASVREPKRELRVEEGSTPVMDIPNKGRRIILCYVAIFMGMFLMFSLPTNFSYYITEIGGNLTMCGLLLGVMGVSQAVFSIFYSRRANKLNEVSAYAISFLLMGIGLALLYIPDLVATFVSMVFVGFCMGLLTLTIIGQLSMYSNANTSGKIMGGYSVSMNIATFLSALAVTPLVSMMDSYQNAFMVLGVVSIVIFAAFAVMRLASKKADIKTVSQEVEVPAVKTAVAVNVPEQMYEHILVATDGSENSNLAAQKAVQIAAKNGSEVTAIFAIDTERYSNIAGSYSSEEITEIGVTLSKEALGLVASMGNEVGVKIISKVAYGHPADVIVEESRYHDLVVCGSVGRTNISRAVMGSVAEKVARMAYCPVLIIRNYVKQ